jgi:dTDP-4-amino-4,6-dideoxygalactose transaminase
MNVPLLDLRAQYATIRDEVERVVLEILRDQQFVLGPTVERFEREIERHSGARHAIGVASGSDALLLALLALGIGRGDTVVTTPFTFFATAGAVSRVGARIVFADIDPETFNVSAETLAAALDRGPVQGKIAILPVHLYGRLAPMDDVAAVARRVGAGVIEDAAQAIGARGPPSPARSRSSARCRSSPRRISAAPATAAWCSARTTISPSDSASFGCTGAGGGTTTISWGSIRVWTPSRRRSSP